MEQITIDLVPIGVAANAHASQFDIGRDIRFNLKDGGVDYTLAGTETITIEMVKPDGSEQTISLTNTSSTYVDWTTADGELDQAGVYSAEISVTQGDDVIGSRNFFVKTEPDPYNNKGLRIVSVGPADICTFETELAEPLVNVKTALAPSLTGYTAVNLTANGDTTTIALGDTYYGGTLDVTMGVPTGTHTKISLGSLYWSYNPAYGFYCSKDSSTWGDNKPLPCDNNQLANIVCQDYTTETYSHTTSGSYDMTIAQGENYLAVSDSRYTDVSTFRNAVANVYLTYELATPITGQLSPTAVRAIVGTNNVFADTGTTELKYLTID